MSGFVMAFDGQSAFVGKPIGRAFCPYSWRLSISFETLDGGTRPGFAHVALPDNVAIFRPRPRSVAATEQPKGSD